MPTMNEEKLQIRTGRSFIIVSLGTNKKMGCHSIFGKKKYQYIPDLILEIERQHTLSTNNLKKGQPSRYDRPANITKTIGNSQPETTKDIVQKKQSRFSEV